MQAVAKFARWQYSEWALLGERAPGRGISQGIIHSIGIAIQQVSQG
jgi:hypothetical protein